MNFKTVKLEFFYWRKAFFQYHRFWDYIYSKYFLARKILKLERILEQPVNQSDFSIHILTCHRDLCMIIWALASFYSVTKVVGQLFIHNDGTLNNKDQFILKKFFPNSIIVDAKDFQKNFSNKLKPYPVLEKFRYSFPHFSFKKIIDPFFVSDKKIHLIIDSDILWFRRPVELEENILSDSKSSLMQLNNAKIYATFKGNQRLSDDLAVFNAGIILYNKENFEIEKLIEFFEKIDIGNPKNLHFADQAGHSYCLKNLGGLPEDKYVINKIVNNSVIAKHYTSPRRPLFYIEGIKILKNIIQG